MRIDIALKLRPFSHTIGTVCLVPYSTWQVAIYCSKLIFQDLMGGQTEEVALPLRGLVHGFTVTLDMEKGQLQVSGREEQGFFRYTITPSNILFAKGQTIPLSFMEQKEVSSCNARVSFGVSKKQDWDLIVRRGDVAEYFPFLFRLASLVPFSPLPKKSAGTIRFLEKGDWELIFQTAFYGMLVPSFTDRVKTGLVDSFKGAESPLSLIHEIAHLLQSLFFAEKQQELYFLAALPKSLHAGRWKGLETATGDRIDFAWSKKRIKKVVIHAAATRSVLCHFPRSVKQCRLRTSPNQKGTIHLLKEPLPFVQGKPLLLDRFSL